MTSGATTMTPSRPGIPAYKVTKPIPPHKVAKPTPRTHEENQERAYIAASRRSDRSLEARMESAKRASEIHKKRTGRPYRITEETVINEQMYEEEDDNPRYRLTSHMHWPNTLLQQRAQAMMSIQMENRKLLGQAVNSTLQHNPQFNQAQFITPGMMQMPQSGYNFLMPSPQMDHVPQSPMAYNHSPYPSPTEVKKPNLTHQRSISVAELPPRQFSQSAQSSPVDMHSSDFRRMSLPPQNHSLQSPQVSTHQKSSTYPPSLTPLNESYPTTPTVSQHSLTPMQHAQIYGGALSAFSNSGPDSDNFMGPLTTAFPRDQQQLLDGGLWPNMGNNSFNMMPQQGSMNPKHQQPFYSYRPNSSSKMGNQQTTTVGLDQTLLATASDSKDLNESNEKSNTSNVGANDNHGGYDFGFDDSTNMFSFDNLEPFNPFSSQNSAQLTPAINEEWTSFLDNDMFSGA